jgi:hypothetical protein
MILNRMKPNPTPRVETGPNGGSIILVDPAVLMISPDVLPRIATADEERVVDLADFMREADAPPLLVVRDEGAGVFWLADGTGRYQGHKIVSNDGEKIRCEVIEWDRQTFATGEQHAVYLASTANAKNAQRLNAQEKRQAVKNMVRYYTDWSPAMMAQHIGCSVSLVNSVRREQGKNFTANIPSLGSGRRFQNASQPDSGESQEPGQAPQTATCPNCGGKSFDADGDCTTCREPHVISITTPVRRESRGHAEYREQAISAAPDKLRDVVADSIKIDDFLTWIGSVGKRVDELRSLPTGAGLKIDLPEVGRLLMSLRATIRRGRYHGPCDCEGGCPRCHGAGWLSE